jgi:hypothetical protein
LALAQRKRKRNAITILLVCIYSVSSPSLSIISTCRGSRLGKERDGSASLWFYLKALDCDYVFFEFPFLARRRIPSLYYLFFTIVMLAGFSSPQGLGNCCRLGVTFSFYVIFSFPMAVVAPLLPSSRLLHRRYRLTLFFSLTSSNKFAFQV